MKRKVIIIGSSNNYNELGLVRSFGYNHIQPYGIIICKKTFWKKEWLHHSKYWKKCFRVANAEEAFNVLQEQFSNEPEKPVVITPVDYIIQMIDDRYDDLSEKFIIPSINRSQGMINFYSNKLEQSKLTESMGFKSLPTRILELETFSASDIAEQEYPIILKPAACGEGSKDDITICCSKEELVSTIEMLKAKKYSRVLCQKYLKNRTEVIAFGAIIQEANLSSFTIIKNIRQWPDGYGVGSFGILINSGKIFKFVNDFYNEILKFGYDGPIDTDLFIDNDTGEFYISEYNWRPGGRNYTSLGTGVYSAVLWYFSKCEIDISKMPLINTKAGYTMNDATDFNHVLCKNISFSKWFKEFKQSCSYALWNKKDIGPNIIPLISRTKRIILKFINRNK